MKTPATTGAAGGLTIGPHAPAFAGSSGQNLNKTSPPKVRGAPGADE